MIISGCGSCEDPGQLTIVEGVVTSSANGVVAANMPIVLWETIDDGLFSSNHTHESFIVFTDSSGFYSMTFFNESDSFFDVQTHSGEDFHCSEIQRIDIGTRNKVDFAVSPHQDILELHFLNEFLTDSTFVSLRYPNDCRGGSFQLESHPNVEKINLEADSIFTLGVQPNSNIEISLAFDEEIANPYFFDLIEIGTGKKVVFIP